MRRLGIILLLTMVPFLGLEWFARSGLFSLASYSNSETVDLKVTELKTRTDWKAIILGDSETRWGLDPAALEQAFPGGTLTPALNFAFDGFGGGLWSVMIGHFDWKTLAPDLKYLMVGVQMIDVDSIPGNGTRVPCGDLQKPVLTSPFARDMGFHHLCEPLTFASRIEDWAGSISAVVRYRAALKHVLLNRSGQQKGHLSRNSASIGPAVRGFQPHQAIADRMKEYEREKGVFLAEQTDNPLKFQPLKRGAWDAMTASGGYFDHWKATADSMGVQLVLFALPTNPFMIDARRRRDDYTRNSALLSAWAKANGAIFIDLGINDKVPMETHYSDHRHLSAKGAEVFSAALAKRLVVSLAGQKPKAADERAQNR